MTAPTGLAALAALTALCPPPADVPPVPDWPGAEGVLGMRLPGDYKELVAAYGPGEFNGFLTLYQPGALNEWVDLTGPVLLGDGPAFAPSRLRGRVRVTALDTRPPVSTSTIRAWARAQGFDVPDRGRVPFAVFEAWEAATRSD